MNLTSEKHLSYISNIIIINRYSQNQFSNQHIATVGIEYFLKEDQIGDKQIRVKIWDTAGQEQYKSLTKNFYKKSNGIIIVFDVTNKDSFSKVKEWFQNVMDCAEENIKMVLIGNKIDLTRAVSFEEGSKLANDLNIPYFETSAKDNIGITETIRTLVSAVVGEKLNILNKGLEIKKAKDAELPARGCKC